MCQILNKWEREGDDQHDHQNNYQKLKKEEKKEDHPRVY